MATLKLGDIELCDIDKSDLTTILNIAICANADKLEEAGSKSIDSLVHWNTELNEFDKIDLQKTLSEMEFFIKRREKLIEIKTNLDLIPHEHSAT